MLTEGIALHLSSLTLSSSLQPKTRVPLPRPISEVQACACFFPGELLAGSGNRKKEITKSAGIACSEAVSGGAGASSVACHSSQFKADLSAEQDFSQFMRKYI